MTRATEKTEATPEHVAVELIDAFASGELHDLCDAADAAILAGGGFGWLAPPDRQILENYWKGVLLVPERQLIVARLDGVICGSAQLVRPPRNNEAQAFTAQLQHAFVAPWARGHGLARMLTEKVEAVAREGGYEILVLDVRETQTRAIGVYEGMDYVCWGTNPYYAKVDGRFVAGRYYWKRLAGDEVASRKAAPKKTASKKAASKKAVARKGTPKKTARQPAAARKERKA
jgi:ribosomal protein S18 acetylase RimI-like enzyme